MIEVEVFPEYYNIEIQAAVISNDIAAQNAADAKRFRDEAEEFALESWISLVSQWDVEPILIQSSSNGDIYQYQRTDFTYYRFVPNPYNASQDAFYSDIQLTQLITSRSI